MARPSFSQRKRTVYGQSLVSDPLYKKQVSAWEGSSWRRAHTVLPSSKARWPKLAICDPTSTGASAYTTSRAATEVWSPTNGNQDRPRTLQTTSNTARQSWGMPVVMAHNARRPCWHRCSLKCCMTREEVWRGSQTVKLLAGWLFCRLLLKPGFDLNVRNSVPGSVGAAVLTTTPQRPFPRVATAVGSGSRSSMLSARKEAWSSRATMTWGTVTCLLPKLQGAVSSWSARPREGQHILLCRLIGRYEVCGKVTGWHIWRSLTIRSLMPTPPSYPDPKPVLGSHCQTSSEWEKAQVMLWSPRSSGDRSLPWCAVLIAFSMSSMQLSSVALQAVLLWSGTDPRPYSRVMSWVRLKSQFAIMNSCGWFETTRKMPSPFWPFSGRQAWPPWCEQCLTDSAKWTILYSFHRHSRSRYLHSTTEFFVSRQLFYWTRRFDPETRAFFGYTSKPF